MIKQDWIENVLNESFPCANFVDAMQDGVLLCKLVLAIKPGSVKKINTSKMQFKMMENIEHFLTV